MPHVLVAGAGIGGLTTSLALARSGVAVTLFERAAGLDEAGAGLQLSPNATRILRRLGVLDALDGDALRPEAIRVRKARNGATLALMPLADAERRWGGPYVVAHRADLQRALVAAVAAEPSVTLLLDTALAGFGVGADGVTAAVRQGRAGRNLSGDALIGADGIRSSVRAKLVDRDDLPQETGRTAWRTMIPAGALDPSLLAPQTTLWLGSDAHLVHYPLRGGSSLNVVAITRDPPSEAAGEDPWSAPGDPMRIEKRFGRWHAEARAVIAAAPTWQTWPLFDRAPLATWHAGPVALLGDAAHPILPFFAQGAAQAIEDAAAVAEAIAGHRDMSAALAAYSAARQARALRVQETSRDLGRLYHLSGAAASARNLGMRMLGGRRLLHRYDWLYGSAFNPRDIAGRDG